MFYPFHLDTTPRDYYKSYPMVDYTHRQSPPTFQPINFHPKDKPFLPPPDVHAPLAITINASQIPKPKISKTNTHPLTSSSAFKAWDPSKSHIQHPAASHMGLGGQQHHPIQQQQHQTLHQQNSRRQAYSNKRQFSIETLPELFSQPLGYGHSPHMHPKHKGLATNSKTEVTVWTWGRIDEQTEDKNGAVEGKCSNIFYILSYNGVLEQANIVSGIFFNSAFSLSLLPRITIMWVIFVYFYDH